MSVNKFIFKTDDDHLDQHRIIRRHDMRGIRDRDKEVRLLGDQIGVDDNGCSL